MLAETTSAPLAANAFALSLPGSRVMARAAKPPDGSARIALTRPPPCEPVEPTTAMTFLSDMNLASDFLANDVRGLGERVQLHLRDHTRERLHAAVAAERDLVGRDVLQRRADALGDLRGRL